MVFMLSCMKNDLILDIFLTRSGLKSIRDFTPNLGETELRWIRYIISESRKGQMSHRVMCIEDCDTLQSLKTVFVELVHQRTILSGIKKKNLCSVCVCV